MLNKHLENYYSALHIYAFNKCESLFRSGCCAKMMLILVNIGATHFEIFSSFMSNWKLLQNIFIDSFDYTFFFLLNDDTFLKSCNIIVKCILTSLTVDMHQQK